VYEPAGAPLHGVYALKQWYIATYNDPIVQWSAETASGHDSWMGLFLHVEFLFLLPTALYGVYRFAVQRRGTSGADELLFLVYAVEVAFTTLVCIHDTYYLDSAVYSEEQLRTLRVQLYGPWCLFREYSPSWILRCDSCLTAQQQPSWPSTWRLGSWGASRRLMLSWVPGSRSSGAAEGRVQARGAAFRTPPMLSRYIGARFEPNP
jgi:hypothetical protein